MGKLTKDQKKKMKAIIGDFEAELDAQDGHRAIDLKTAKDIGKKVWACTPEIKLKKSNYVFDLQLTEDQTRGGTIRIIRTGSNRIKICSVVETKYLNDGVAEAKKEAKKLKKAEESEGKDAKISLVSKNKN